MLKYRVKVYVGLSERVRTVVMRDLLRGWILNTSLDEVGATSCC